MSCGDGVTDSFIITGKIFHKLRPHGSGKENKMLNKKLIAVGLTTLMVASTPVTVLAEGPDRGHDSFGENPEGSHSEESHHEDSGHEAPPEQNTSSGTTPEEQPPQVPPAPQSYEASGQQDQPPGGVPADGQQAPPELPSQNGNGAQSGQNGPQSNGFGPGSTQPDGQMQPNGQFQPDGQMQPNGQLQPDGQMQPNGQFQPDGQMQPNGQLQPDGQMQMDIEWYKNLETTINQILEEMGQNPVTLEDIMAMVGQPSDSGTNNAGQGMPGGSMRKPEMNRQPGPDTGTSGEKTGESGVQVQPAQNGNNDRSGINGRPGEPGGNTASNNPSGPQSGMNGKPGGMDESSAPKEYAAANTLTEDSSDTDYSSKSDNENAILVDGKQVTITGSSISKSGDASGEDADFYGTNAGILANNGANLTLSDVNVTTDGAHANGVFSYGSGTSLTITDSTITTTGNNSGGLMTTGGAALNASNVTIDTSGNSSAAIRTDRGGGTVTVDKISGSTSGVGSPAIYSTADITVTGSSLKADSSEAVVIEGGNSVTITDSDLTGNNSKLNGQSTIATNVLIYQSMSGDASEGSSDFTMTGGSLTSQKGCMFHVTNVTTTINLTDVDLNYASGSDEFMVLSADSWGSSGKNGGNATVNLSDQEVSGDITVDSISSLVMNLTDGSSYTGAINSDSASSSVKVNIESGSSWKLTGDSYVSSLTGNTSGIDYNGYTLYVNGKAYNT